MAWIRDYKYRWYEKISMEVFKIGPIPNHIAFIMDGNRRYAKNSHLEKIEGHTKGFDKLSECLKWCLDIGVREVTAFAFSIENFKRSQDEVDGLLNLAKEKFEQLLEEEEKLRENGVRIRVLGNLSLLPQPLQQVVAKAMLITEQNDKLYLNIAFSYTSRDEITNSFLEIIEETNITNLRCSEISQNGEKIYSNNVELIDEISADDIDEYVMTECLYTNNSTNPDLLIRTSGESRISDFLMWQLTTTVLYFTKILWPQLSIWIFLYGIFLYQRAKFNLNFVKEEHQNQSIKNNELFKDRVKNFLYRLNRKRHEKLINLANGKFKGD